MLRLRGSGEIRDAVRDHLRARPGVAGARVVDLPAGSGGTSAILRELGADVRPYDLFPKWFRAEGLTCRFADLNEPLPIESAAADLVLFQESVEHLPDPGRALRELNRILVPGGRLLLTTPNVSHLRARASWFLAESDLYNRLPPDSAEAVWHREGGREYYGHIHLIGAQKIRLLARLAGFRLRAIHPVKASLWSLLLLPVCYPALLAINLFAWRRTLRRRGAIAPGVREELREILRLNLHPAILAGKHLFLELEKTAEVADAAPAVTKAQDSIL